MKVTYPPTPEGKTCITTTVNSKYIPFIPLFTYCAHKAYPDYDIVVFTTKDGYGTHQDSLFDVSTGKTIIKDIQTDSNRLSNEWVDYGYNAAALRFLLGDECLSQYKYTLITDVDIFIRHEDPPLHVQHYRNMVKNNTLFYDNYTPDNNRCLGVHFVTEYWWDATISTRIKILDEIKNRNIGVGEDEQLLYRIIKDSQLPGIPQKPLLWSDHGIHLGAFRRTGKLRLDAGHQEYWMELIDDEIFVTLFCECAKKFTYLEDFDDAIRLEYPTIYQ